MEGIFAIYKPQGLTSYDIIRQLKKITGESHIGHAGTLDPLASGVLVVGIGKTYTKKLASEVAKEKEYIAEIRLGVTSSTDDEEGEKTVVENPIVPDIEKIKNILPQFIGKIKQVPPVYSAIKVAGREAYKYMRAGESVALNEREVEVRSIELLNYKWPVLKLRIVTGPGVYIRSLARDLGQSLGIGGHIYSLERTRVGEFTIDKSLQLDQI